MNLSHQVRGQPLPWILGPPFELLQWAVAPSNLLRHHKATAPAGVSMLLKEAGSHECLAASGHWGALERGFGLGLILIPGNDGSPERTG